MTLEGKAGLERKFVPAILPWLIAIGALGVYLATLNHWVSFNSLNQGNLLQVAKVSGWTWQPELYAPLNWLITFPFHWLPIRTIPLALNLFSAVCAALTLALLARSVALLPHDRTCEQRERGHNAFSLLSIRTAWVPPVLAVLVCGLQLTFWENATAASSSPPLNASTEMLDLLLFAYVIRCLLEFRLDERVSWLTRASFVFAAAMANNWAMIGFSPLFLIALLWIKGLRFFNTRFLVRMSLCGLAGLLFYLLLPLVQHMGTIKSLSFWMGLKANLAAQKSILAALPFSKYALFYGDKTLWVLALPALLPLLLIGIRWPSSFGDPSPLGVALTTLIFRLIHGALLALCIWVALDSPLSPRHLIPNIPLLTFYYCGALSVGYFCGYFLLVFQNKSNGRSRQSPPFLPLINTCVTCALWVVCVMAPAVLIYRNLPQIRVSNGPLFEKYASLVAQGLPAKGAVLLSDDPRRLLVMQSATAQRGKSEDYVFVETTYLAWPNYQFFLKKNYPKCWQVAVPKEPRQPFSQRTVLGILYGLTQTNIVYYLHPSFGYFFEEFCLEPHGLVYMFAPYPTNTIFSPLPTKELITENEAYWTRTDGEVLRPLLAKFTPSISPPIAFMDWLVGKLHLKKEPNLTVSLLAAFYSRALDYWGVEMQKSSELTQAATHFERAQDLNPDNVVASINLEFNRNLQTGHRSSVQLAKSVEDEFGRYKGWIQVLNNNGPFDEPNFIYEQGRVFARASCFRQAAAEFERVKVLAPENLVSRLWLGQMYITCRMPDQALRVAEEIHAESGKLGLSRTNGALGLLYVESSAHLAKGDINGADTAVKVAMRKYPDDGALLAATTQVYIKYGCFSNALAMIDEQLKLTPDDLSVLINKGFVCLQLNAFEQAIVPLTRVLDREPKNYGALINRAIAYLRCKKLNEAQSDYESLQKAFPKAFRVYFGLGDIAYQKKDTKAAIRNYELYLANSPTNNPEAKTVNARLKELKSGVR